MSLSKPVKGIYGVRFVRRDAIVYYLLKIKFENNKTHNAKNLTA